MVILPPGECPAYFNAYLAEVNEDVLQAMEMQLESYTSFLKQVPKEKETFRYAPGKWTVKEVIGHVTDTERLLANRALRIARNDQTPIPGFEENAYVAATDFNAIEMEFLIVDFRFVRRSNISLLQSLKENELRRIGMASDKPVSARALFYFMAGHLQHHQQLILERYLS